MTTETVLPLLLAAFLALISLGSAYWVRCLYRLRSVPSQRWPR
ncbi:hypothetical protein [Streptomyces mirabilis]